MASNVGSTDYQDRWLPGWLSFVTGVLVQRICGERMFGGFQAG
jgi:hypothetical protein